MSEGLTWNVYDSDKLSQREIYGLVLCELGERSADRRFDGRSGQVDQNRHLRR